LVLHPPGDHLRLEARLFVHRTAHRRLGGSVDLLQTLELTLSAILAGTVFTKASKPISMICRCTLLIEALTLL
jgi:hypothetical protein